MSVAAAIFSLPRQTLEAMAEAGREVRTWERILGQTGDTVISEVTQAAPKLVLWTHYPPGDVYDTRHHAQYYFHLHPELERPFGELGHFHTFLRGPAMAVEESIDVVCHLIAIGVSEQGRAVRLFTTNRWVTDETWRPASEVSAMLDRFSIGHAQPSWPVNRWVGAVLRLFRPQIIALLAERDRAVAAWTCADPNTDTLEDRALEVTSLVAISVEEQLTLIEQSLAQSGAPARPAASAAEQDANNFPAPAE